MKNVIQRSWRIPWETIEDIKKEMQQQNASIKHIFREENQMTDYLAINQAGFQEFKFFT